ncbi:membrane traffic protein [Lithospermum erythrorhizon]
MTSYFMGLSPSNSNDDVRVKDQVSNSERSFKKSEIEGSPAIKLDISLKKPIILMPKRTDSADYMKLDVVHITVKNSFRWVYGSRNEMNAVHLDMMTIQVKCPAWFGSGFIVICCTEIMSPSFYLN